MGPQTDELTNAALIGTVDLDWQLGGFAACAPTASPASVRSSSQVGQLVQAMAGFGGGGAGESLNTAPLAPDTAQQPLLTPPQHG